MSKYTHRVFYIATEEEFSVIKTKKAFREAMIKYYFEDKNERELAFELLESSQKFRIILYISRNNQPSICFSKIEFVSSNNEDVFEE